MITSAPDLDLTCKLFNFDNEDQWINNGVGRARIQKIEGKYYSVFTKSDGSEYGWEINPNSEFKKDSQCVVCFKCTKTKIDHALSFKFEKSADYYWNRIETILIEMSRPPEDSLILPTKHNLHILIQNLEELELPYLTLLRKSDYLYRLLTIFQELERDFQDSGYSRKSKSFHSLQQLVAIVYQLRK